MLGAIAEAGGASLLTFWLMVWVELDSFMFRFVLSDVVLFSLTFRLSVVTFDSEVDWLILVFWLVLELVEVELLVFVTFWLTVELTVELDVEVEVLMLLLVLVLFEVEVFTFVFELVETFVLEFVLVELFVLVDTLVLVLVLVFDMIVTGKH